MRGRSTVASWPGGLVSFAIFFIILLYGTIKLIHLLSRHNPNLAAYTEQNVFDSSEIVSFKEKNIRFAFGIEGFLDKDLKNDPRYVKSLVRMWGRKAGKSYEIILPYHRCTNEELDSFAPPSRESVGMLESMKKDPDRGLYCMDWDKIGDDLSVWSVTEDDDYQRWEFVLLPCNYIHAEFNDIGDSVHPECIANLEEQ